MKDALKKSKEDCLPTTDAQEGLDILIKHFLGNNWYSLLPILCQQQINTDAIYEILERYPRKKSIWTIKKKLLNKRCLILNLIIKEGYLNEK